MTRKIASYALSIAFASFLLISPSLAQAQASPAAQESGQQKGKIVQQRSRDQNGDGICDVCGQPAGSGQRNAQGQRAKKGFHYGPGDGTGNLGSAPKDGTGYGRKAGNRDPNSCPNPLARQGNRGSRGGRRGGRN